MADKNDDTTETAMRHLSDPGTAEIIAPGESNPELLASSAGMLHGSGLGADAGYAEIPAAARTDADPES